MKTIAIVGKADKRLIVYSLVRALSVQHSVCIITDDGAYRRLYIGDENTGTIGRVDISIEPTCKDKAIAQLEEFGTKYDYMIIDSSGVLPTECDYVIYCKGIDKSFGEEERLEIKEEVPHKEVVISYNTYDSKTTTFIVLNDTLQRYIYNMEETKQLKRIKDKNLNKILAKTLSEAVGKTPTELFNLLMSKDKRESK